MTQQFSNTIPDALRHFDALPDSAYVRQPVVEALWACAGGSPGKRSDARTGCPCVVRVAIQREHVLEAARRRADLPGTRRPAARKQRTIGSTAGGISSGTRRRLSNFSNNPMPQKTTPAFKAPAALRKHHDH